MSKIVPPLLCALLLTGCEQLGLEDPAKIAAAREAEGRAIGSACRHSGRALEECYDLNKKVSKAAIFTGWRDMDAYMRENNIQVIPPAGAVVEKPAEPPKEKVESGEGAEPKAGGSVRGAVDLPLPAPAGRARQA
jgi:hypothetical protein